MNIKAHLALIAAKAELLRRTDLWSSELINGLEEIIKTAREAQQICEKNLPGER